MSGGIVWLTGLPASGKSTVATATSRELSAAGIANLVLDGDVVRSALVPAPGYDDAGRDAFYETLARLAALIAEQGTIALVPATAHLRRYRERAGSLASTFLEVFVDTPLDECQRRDPKGLYRGKHPALPGQGVDYEPPVHPDLVIRPDTPDASHQLAELIRARV